jgi:small subunit ribosomal protein S8
MKREGYLENVEVIGAKPKEMITVTFVPGRTLTVKRESAPGRRRYLNTSQTKPVLSGFGMAILSTSSGLLTDTEARAKKVGGEILCTVS